ncbi:unnamed protein product, partial [Ectocarpus sp. 4 AP-2014]
RKLTVEKTQPRGRVSRRCCMDHVEARRSPGLRKLRRRQVALVPCGSSGRMHIETPKQARLTTPTLCEDRMYNGLKGSFQPDRHYKFCCCRLRSRQEANRYTDTHRTA